MTYDEAIELIDEHTDYGGSLDKHALAIAIATSDAPASQPKSLTDEQIRSLRKATEILCATGYHDDTAVINAFLADMKGQS